MQDNTNFFIHIQKAFASKSIEKRANKLGFKNLNRFEIFLWDLEFYCQIQRLLWDKIVLKGGLAAQMYIPIDYQRTSVDIDMITVVTKSDIEKVLKQIKQKFSTENQIYDYEQHIPKNPKTDLPLFTYYFKFPSTIVNGQHFKDEIKLEFIIDKKLPKIYTMKNPKLFAIEKTLEYKILPINILLADKLTTLGPNTVGIPDNRNDEQPKQIYDIYHLLKFNIEKINIDKIFENYYEFVIRETKIREKNFIFYDVTKDVKTQLEKITNIENKPFLWKNVLDFQSLYLTKNINYKKQDWAIIGLSLQLFYNILIVKKDIEIMKKAFKIEEILKFNNVSGEKKGEIIKKFKNEFLEQYNNYAKMDVKLLKGKKQTRIFWEIVSEKNIDLIYKFIKKFLGVINDN